jgi:hypothetical protein
MKDAQQIRHCHRREQRHMAIPPPSSDSQQRRLWHDLLDRAIAKAAASGETFTVERVLDSIGMFSWASDRAQALVYANKMLETHPNAATTKRKKEKL